MTIGRFEELDCWQAARALVNQVYDITADDEFARDFGLKDQIRRAAISVMANVSEGFGTNSAQEFIRFLGYSVRSAFEVQSHLYVARDRCYVSQQVFDGVFAKANDCIKLCKGFVRYLRETEGA